METRMQREGGMSRGREWVTDGEMNVGKDWWRDGDGERDRDKHKER